MMSPLATPLRTLIAPIATRLPTWRPSQRIGAITLDDAPIQTNSGKSRTLPSWIQEQLAEEQLESTIEQRMMVSVSFGLNLSLLLHGLLLIGSWDEAVVSVLALYGGYLIADLLSGIYHWSIDNYGSKSTPIFGNQINGFQRHHCYPWTITYRQFCNNIAPICLPAIPFSAAIWSLHPPAPVEIFAAIGCMMVVLSQQFHSWAHTKRRDLPVWVQRCQDLGLLVSTRMHCQHHRSPFDINYCIVSGVWNPLLDRYHIFTRLERVIHRCTGVEPRSWCQSSSTEDVAYFND